MAAPTINPKAPATSPQFSGNGAFNQVSVQVQHSDLTAAATTETLSNAVAQLDATLDAIIHAVWIDVVTEAAGGSVSDASADVGPNGGTITDYVSGADIFSAAGPVGLGGTVKYLNAGTGIDVRVNTTSDNVDALTALDMTIYVQYSLVQV